MKINFIPKTILGKWSVGLIIFLLLVLVMPQIRLPAFGPLAAVCGVVSFFTGMIAVIRQKERSISVIISTVIGFLATLFVIAEILFPH